MSESGAKNVVLVILEDMRPDPPGGALTPNLDALAARGTVFTNAYCQAPICAPSRASLLTGLDPLRTGVLDSSALNWWDHVDPTTTLPAVLRGAGYATLSVGKVFHALATDVAPSQFDEIVAVRDVYDHFSIPGFAARIHRGVAPLKDEARVEAALDRLPALAGGDQPFFLALGMSASHAPWIAPEAYFDLYPAESVPLPDVPPDDLADVPDYAIDEFVNRELNDRFVREGVERDLIRGHVAKISYADAQIGRLLQALEDQGIADNTVIVVVADHGFHFGEKEHWAKNTLWEESAHVPMMIVDPTLGAAGNVVDSMVSLVDVFPTLLDLLGIAAPSSELDGESLRALLESPDAASRDEAFTGHLGNIAVRTADWRFIRYVDGSRELYDMRGDPGQLTNLAGRSDLAEVEADLSARVDRYLAENNIRIAAPGETEIEGSDDIDIFVPGTGPKLMRGGAGDDIYIVGHVGDTVEERAEGGIDTLILRPTVTSYALPENVEIGVWGGRTDSVLIGNSLDNRLYGTFGAQHLEGGGGDDWLNGGSGDDVLEGGDGDDVLLGEGGNDHVIAGPGNDDIQGGYEVDLYDAAWTRHAVVVDLTAGRASGIEIGNDTLSGIDDVAAGAGDDVLVGSSSANRFVGGAGNDSIDGRGGSDLIDLSGSTAPVWVSLVVGKAKGADTGRDSLTSIEGAIGGQGDDVLLGNSRDNFFSGGAGDDRIEGRGGIDTLDVSTSQLAVHVDLLAGTASGADIGNDVIQSIENVIGGSGNDTLLGRNGDNIFVASAGNDTIDGRDGRDTYDASAARAALVVDLQAGFARGRDVGRDTLASIEVVLGGVSADQITGSDGNDRLFGGRGDDVLLGMAGNDVLSGGLGSNLLDGGAGLDTADYATITASLVIDLVAGTTTGLPDGVDTLVSIERVVGSRGDDRLISSRRSEELTGGRGDDIFEFRDRIGHDIVHDFTDGRDRLAFSGFGEAFDTAEEIIAAARQVGGDIRIDLEGPAGIAGSVTLAGLDLAVLDRSDFASVLG